ncbi:hypothetical protein [Vampirovibrio sp.]|uniref:hypothetical protein n=1 Tax=Vampirovibrio sp. TaxID=2717857 RepID=UPI003593E17D
MGVNFSNVSGAVKRAVSSKAREAHKAEQQQVQERIAQARASIKARRANENQQATALFNQIKDEVDLEQAVKLKNSLPSVPTHRVGANVPNRRNNG